MTKFLFVLVIFGLIGFVFADEKKAFLNTKTLSNLPRCYVEDIPEDSKVKFIYHFTIPDPMVANKPFAQQTYVQLQITDPENNVIIDKKTGLSSNESFVTKVCLFVIFK